jgi:hypothetical protein
MAANGDGVIKLDASNRELLLSNILLLYEVDPCWVVFDVLLVIGRDPSLRAEDEASGCGRVC